jgi:dolichol-phosphate mannosyltransferase
MRSLTFVVPALNEENGLSETLDELTQLLNKRAVTDFEILVFDDGSTDGTGRIADLYSRRVPQIRVFHNKSPQGIGCAYKQGIKLAKKDLLMLVHGDNEISPTLIHDLLNSSGQADFSISYIFRDRRSFSRALPSKLFTFLVNLISGLNVRYFNGPSLIPVKLLREILLETDGHAFMAETIVRLTQRGYTFTEVGFEMRIRSKGKSKAFSLKNVRSVIKALSQLWLISKAGVLKK